MKLFFRKASHQRRIRQALKLLKKFNQLDFKKNPAGLFAYIKKIDPFVFEELLLLSFLFRGFKVIHNTRYTGDGGIDGVVILPNRQRVAIQAKRYANHINPAHVLAFREDFERHGCHQGLFIHCGKSGAGLYDNLASDITLASGNHLHALLTQVNL